MSTLMFVEYCEKFDVIIAKSSCAALRTYFKLGKFCEMF